jgi:hypothetical protein
MSYVGIIKHIDFQIGFFHLVKLRFLCVFHDLLVLSKIPLPDCLTADFSIHLLKDILVSSKSENKAA